LVSENGILKSLVASSPFSAMPEEQEKSFTVKGKGWRFFPSGEKYYPALDCEASETEGKLMCIYRE